jgi:predicted molibdopterin-dependent oxidoreductase YjgC
MRVEVHPILGTAAAQKIVTIYVDGEPMPAHEGEPIAAALMAAGKRVFRYSKKRQEPRGYFCGLGRCTDCIMTVDGVPQVRTCITPVADGMRIETQKGFGEWSDPTC